jgi:hypothetical protein
MRSFTLLVSALFVAVGIGMFVSGDSSGWLVAGFFGLCLLVAVFEPRFPKLHASSGYRVVITNEGIACEHPKRARESIRWEDVRRIWYVKTSDGPRIPDEWILLEGDHGGCSYPAEATGFEGVWDVYKQRFTGLNYGPLIRGGTDDARQLLWERQPP